MFALITGPASSSFASCSFSTFELKRFAPILRAASLGPRNVTTFPTRATSARRRPSQSYDIVTSKQKKRKIFKFVRTVPTQLSTTTRGEKTYEINAKWGESKKPPRTASTATSSRLFSYRAAQAEQTAGPLYRKTSRFNVKSRKFCPPKPQRHISIVRAAKHLGCRSYANESVTCHLPCAQRPTPAPRVRPSTKCDILPGDGSIFVCYSRAGLLSPCASRKRHTVRA